MSKLIGARILALLFAAISLIGCSKERSYEFLAARALTEDEAISYSRDALRDTGVSVEHARPVMYWPADTPNVKERYFARNISDENRGVVLWKVDSGSDLWDYQVTLTREGDRILCIVGRAK